jgi:hypothetical protein
VLQYFAAYSSKWQYLYSNLWKLKTSPLLHPLVVAQVVVVVVGKQENEIVVVVDVATKTSVDMNFERTLLVLKKLVVEEPVFVDEMKLAILPTTNNSTQIFLETKNSIAMKLSHAAIYLKFIV